MALIDDIKRTYSGSSMLMRIIFINIAVFVLIRVLALGSWMVSGDATSLLQWVAVPGDLWLLLKRPWTLVTYMFTHAGLLHILFNMLWLYWMGRIFMEFFSSKHLTGLYLLGGWGGAALYLLTAVLLPRLAGGPAGMLIGSSAAVIAIVVAVAVYVPDYKIGLLFLGEVAIKWVAIVTVAIAVLSLDGINSGGNIAHIGGALVGAWFALRIKQGRDITRPLNAAIDAIVGLFNGRSWSLPRANHGNSRQQQWSRPSGKPSGQSQGQQSGPTARPNRPADEVSEQELDAILDKIKAAGYDALTDEERDKLFKVSRRR